MTITGRSIICLLHSSKNYSVDNRFIRLSRKILDNRAKHLRMNVIRIAPKRNLKISKIKAFEFLFRGVFIRFYFTYFALTYFVLRA